MDPLFREIEASCKEAEVWKGGRQGRRTNEFLIHSVRVLVHTSGHVSSMQMKATKGGEDNRRNRERVVIGSWVREKEAMTG